MDFTTNSTINSTISPTSTVNSTEKPPFNYALYSSMGKIVGFSLGYSIISLVALIGNFMVILVVFLNKNMHTATNVLLLNLSISDTVMVILGVPSLLQSEIYNARWVLGRTLAKITQTSITLSAASAIFTMMAIALERYIAVVHPFKQMARKKKGTIITAIFLIWACALAVSLPTFLTADVAPLKIHPILRDGTISKEVMVVEFALIDMSAESFRIYTIVVFIALNVIPVIVLSYFYARIVWKLWNPDRQLVGLHGHNQENSFVARARRKTTTMLIVVLAVFVLLMFPFNILNLVIANLPRSSVNTNELQTTGSVLKLLVILNTATNPVIYNFLSEKFRIGFRHIFSCHCQSAATVEPVTDGETIIS